MAKDILLFGRIYEYSVYFFYDQIKEATKEDPAAIMTLRINSEGGSPDYGVSMITKVQENADQFEINVEAQAHSMALFFLCYVAKEKTQCLDVTKAVLHRAAYPDYIESASWFPGSIQQDIVTRANKDLEKAFRARVDVEVLEALPQFVEKNIKLKDIFDMTRRVEVLLTGADLKKIGLVARVEKITPTRATQNAAILEVFNKNYSSLDEYKIAAQSATPAEPTAQNENQNTTMTITKVDELRAAYPALVALIEKEASTAAAQTERERIEGILVYAEHDLKSCIEAIAGGKNLTPKQQNELMLKASSANALAALTKDSAGKTTTGEATTTVVKTEAQKNGETFLAEVRGNLGLKPEAVAAV